jgi:hypothetical protein
MSIYILLQGSKKCKWLIAIGYGADGMITGK